MVGEAPFRHDRAAARDDAGHALRRHRDERQPHARVHGEVIHPLLALLDQRVAVDLPGQLLRLPVHLLQRLVDRHRADRHRRVADDPFPRLVDVLSGGEVHHGVAAPADRPRHLLDLLLDAGGDRGIADVGVDLHQEIAPDDHGLGLRVIDVGGNDGAAARDLVAHELGGDGLRNRGAEVLPRVLPAQELRERAHLLLPALVLADRDELHLRRDHAAARVVHLRHVHARPRTAWIALQVEAQLREPGIREALAPVARGGPFKRLRVTTLLDPFAPQRREARADVDLHRRIGVGARSVVDENRRIDFGPE